MSTLKVNKIEATGTTDGGIEIDSDGHVQLDGVQLPTAGPLSHRNMVVNGGMMVAQRGTSGTVADGYNQVDRVYTWHQHDGAVTESRSTDTPNNQFSHSLKHEVDTADTSIGSNQYHAFRFASEGYDSAAIAGWGTSDARKVTVSFWCKSSVTGEYGATMRNGSSNRFNQQSITINTADTWEYKTITYTGDTGGTWGKTNGVGMIFQLSLAMGSTYQGTAGDSWKTSIEVASSNQVNWLATAGNTFYLTGLQIELGSKATPFEHRSYDDELNRCRRYYQEKHFGQSGLVAVGITWDQSAAVAQIDFLKEMRTEPSITMPTSGQAVGTMSFLSSSSFPTTTGSNTATNITTTNFRVYGSDYSGLQGGGQACWLYPGGTGTGGGVTFKFAAEL